jgi:hypothetical protein
MTKKHPEPPTKKKKGKKTRPIPVEFRAPYDERGALAPKAELFVELYFALNFNVMEAAGRAGYTATVTNKSNIYRMLNTAPLQAAIAKRRAALRERAAMTRDEMLRILARLARNESSPAGSIVSAIVVAARMEGMLDPDIAIPDRPDAITAMALRVFPREDIIARINRRELLATTQAKVIDVKVKEKTG